MKIKREDKKINHSTLNREIIVGHILIKVKKAIQQLRDKYNKQTIKPNSEKNEFFLLIKVAQHMRANGLEINVMAGGHISGLIKLVMKDFERMIKHMVKELSFMSMVIYLRVIGLRIKQVDMVFILM